MSDNLEDLAKSLGVNIVSSQDSQTNTEEQATEVEATEPIIGQEEPNVLEDNEKNTTDPEEKVVEEAEAIEPEPITIGTSALEDITSVSESDEDLLRAVSEMVGIDNLTKEELVEIFNGEPAEEERELDPTVKVIADFIAETGRTVEDWFKYQSFNPSEMDDWTIMKTELQQKYPDISGEDAQLLLEAKYKQNEDEHNENDVRLGKLQLMMDAKGAREGLEKVRETYRAPERSGKSTTASAAEEVPSLINDAWIANMSKTVDEMETLRFKVGDKDFAFGLDSKYKSSLKKNNADLENYFVQYVDNQGSWDFNRLSQHRAILDNIDAIVKAVYGQGVSDGQSNVVKEAINPSSTAPSSTSIDSSSAEDKVRKQVLNALRGGDDTISIRF